MNCVTVWAWRAECAHGPHYPSRTQGEGCVGPHLPWRRRGEQGDEGAHLRAGEGGRSGTSTKPMLCRYCTYCCRKAKLSSFNQGSSRAPRGGPSEESQLAADSRLPEADSGRWRRCWGGG